MKKTLQYLFDYKTLSRQQAREVLLNISRGMYSDAEVASFVTVFLMRNISVPELTGFADAMMEMCVPVDLKGIPALDIVGTGGDGKNTFNISTLSCFIVAGAGQPVAKHGNYGATSISGSSNVMENLGYRFSNENDKLLKELEAVNICFMHAPLFHSALKNVAPVRKSLGIRTFFNMLGPLVNPARPATQMIGVYNMEMARVYTYMLQQAAKRFTIIHSLEGYDEISLTGDTKVITNEGEKILSASYLGKRTVAAPDIYGGNSAADAAKMFMAILKGEGTWAQNAVVLANAAMGLFATGEYDSYEASYDLAVDSLESGNAFRTFEKLIAMQ